MTNEVPGLVPLVPSGSGNRVGTTSGEWFPERFPPAVRRGVPEPLGRGSEGTGGSGFRGGGSRPPTQLSDFETERLRRSMCGRKARLSEHSAQRAAMAARGQGTALSAYPCPLCVDGDRRWWHVGHPPTMATVELLARYLRFGSVTPPHESGEVE
jgi:hypothetical protein